jgi:hypothetical protein
MPIRGSSVVRDAGRKILLSVPGIRVCMSGPSAPRRTGGPRVAVETRRESVKGDADYL